MHLLCILSYLWYNYLNVAIKFADCSGLYSIANGTLQLTTKGKTTYGSTATVLCETGFTPSETEITCTANEEWENATCKINGKTVAVVPAYILKLFIRFMATMEIRVFMTLSF